MVDLGGQVGTENRPKIDPAGHWKPLPPLLDQDGAKMEPIWAKIGPDVAKMAPRWAVMEIKIDAKMPFLVDPIF